MLLTLTGCEAHWGLPVRGYGYPGGLAAFAPRTGGAGNFTYYPRFEAYYHHSTQQFYFPNGKKWETQPALPGATPQEVRISVTMALAEPPDFPAHDRIGARCESLGIVGDNANLPISNLSDWIGDHGVDIRQLARQCIAFNRRHFCENQCRIATFAVCDWNRVQAQRPSQHR